MLSQQYFIDSIMMDTTSHQGHHEIPWTPPDTLPDITSDQGHHEIHLDTITEHHNGVYKNVADYAYFDRDSYISTNQLYPQYQFTFLWL